MPDTNSGGTRIWTLTYTRSDTPFTTVVTYPTPFVNWPEYYLWEGVMSFTHAGGNATTQCVHHEATATPRYLTATPVVTDAGLFDRPEYLADPYGLNHELEFTSKYNDPYLYYSSLFPGEPPLTQCPKAAVLPDGRGGRWVGRWFIETTSSVSYEDETTTTTDSEEAVTTSSESGRVIVQLPTTSTDSPSPSPPPPPSSSTRQNDDAPTSTEDPRSSVPTTSARVELPSASDGSAPTSPESLGRESESKTQAPPTTTVSSETTVVSKTAVISETAVSSQIPGSQTMVVSQNSVPQTTVGLQILVSQTTGILHSLADAQTTTTQRINDTSTKLADATSTTVDVVEMKPVVLIPVVRATVVKTAEDGSVETVVAFVPDDTAMSSTSIGRFAKYLKPGAQVHAAAEETAAEEAAVVEESTDGDAEESTVAPVTTYRSWSLGRPAPVADPVPDPVPSRQAAGGMWHRPDWALVIVMAMTIAFV
ncbi:hypothetical protein F5X68DRAFT_190661 [Plectosphaerella plurivora]|uniref:Uncharacterized protein n=1 Tax=Plectosphaerella plurivora TaxID=936078 RepID=A0A9P8VBX6_9PEZI|nr:hypothetical protein F5X68DRAFT_190661 [Plectosphaerella plurivora]